MTTGQVQVPGFTVFRLRLHGRGRNRGRGGGSWGFRVWPLGLKVRVWRLRVRVEGLAFRV